MAAGDQPTRRGLALYATATGAGADGQHLRLSGWFWWAWNAKSADTGGVVQANWRDVNWNKVDYLGTLGLRPWYR